MNIQIKFKKSHLIWSIVPPLTNSAHLFKMMFCLFINTIKPQSINLLIVPLNVLTPPPPLCTFNPSALNYIMMTQIYI